MPVPERLTSPPHRSHRQASHPHLVVPPKAGRSRRISAPRHACEGRHRTSSIMFVAEPAGRARAFVRLRRPSHFLFACANSEAGPKGVGQDARSKEKVTKEKGHPAWCLPPIGQPLPRCLNSGIHALAVGGKSVSRGRAFRAGIVPARKGESIHGLARYAASRPRLTAAQGTPVEHGPSGNRSCVASTRASMPSPWCVLGVQPLRGCESKEPKSSCSGFAALAFRSTANRLAPARSSTDRRRYAPARCTGAPCCARRRGCG